MQQFDQLRKNYYNACVFVSCYTAICNTYNIEMSDEDMDWIINLAISKGWDKSVWVWSEKWIWIFLERRNKNKNIKFNFVKKPLNKKRVEKTLWKYPVVWSYKMTNKNYWDIGRDWVMDEEDGNIDYWVWHQIAMFKSDKKWFDRMHVDSFARTAYYNIRYTKNWYDREVYEKYIYIFVPKKMIIKSIDKLEPNFRKKVSDFLLEVWDEIFLTETLRSQKRQNELYTQWRTKPWKIVTWTKNSLHTQGRAIDIAFKWNELYPKDLSKWQYIRAVAKKHWIDNLWTKDKPHLQDDFTPYKQSMNEIEKQTILKSIYSLQKIVKNYIITKELKDSIEKTNKLLEDLKVVD